MRTHQKLLLSVCALATANLAMAQDKSASDLAKAAQNPLASLVTLPGATNRKRAFSGRIRRLSPGASSERT